MKFLGLFVIAVLLIGTIFGCFFYEKHPENSEQSKLAEKSEQSESVEDYEFLGLAENYIELMPLQKQEMIDLYNTHKQLLHNIWHLVCSDKNIVSIESDGYIVYKDGTKKLLDDISKQICSLHTLEGKDYTYIVILFSNNKNRYFRLETYYPKTQTVYTILYSETDLTKGEEGDWYTRLDDCWFLWETPMT